MGVKLVGKLQTERMSIKNRLGDGVRLGTGYGGSQLPFLIFWTPIALVLGLCRLECRSLFHPISRFRYWKSWLLTITLKGFGCGQFHFYNTLPDWLVFASRNKFRGTRAIELMSLTCPLTFQFSRR